MDLIVFLGGFGIHRFYLGKTVSVIILLILTLVTVWFTAGIHTLIWLIVDAFFTKNDRRQ
ncbi:NINE protein [Thermoanaerobacterium thermosaccharolyticum]|uniref:TM2 domain-containing protein n=1 Tax=Thermoanaerobacterium thermosaccharolyticum M0795 TaxID=698948 RepID=L0IKS0_THETR|nr:NINE protein [Thermoanaerobacterium thermosaccharolyticum]AGB18582.1 TM2 domain-containing protein [Thermoanaerobacterium thermosaccharolyticum M0795]